MTLGNRNCLSKCFDFTVYLMLSNNRCIYPLAIRIDNCDHF